MKKTKILLTIILLLVFLSPLSVVLGDDDDGAVTITNPLTEFDTLEEIATALINFAIKVAIPISSILFIIAAFFYLTAGANPENVNKAKSIIVWTIIGLSIILIAGGISALIRNILSL